jgi:hypothetical protein
MAILLLTCAPTYAVERAKLICGSAYKQCSDKCGKDEKESPFTPESAHRYANQCNVACHEKFCH